MDNTDNTIDIVDFDDSYKTEYERETAKNYQNKYAGKSFKDIKNNSILAAVVKTHQYPMDPPDIQNQRLHVIKNLPDPKRAWLIYYHGAYIKKYGLLNYSQASPPGDIKISFDKPKIEDLL